MKVLVTGARGTLGRRVTERLSATDWQVVAHDREDGNLCDPGHVSEIMRGMDAVVHAAAIPNPIDGADAEIFGNNVDSTYHVLDTAGRQGVPRVVNISSASAIGFAWSEKGLSPIFAPVTEEHPYVGDDVYGLSKQIGEVIAGAASRRWGTSILSLRFPFIGDGDRLLRHLGPIHADPGVDTRGLWSWLDTRDAAEVIAVALTAPITGAHVITVTSPETTALVPTRDLLRRYHPSTRIEGELGEFESVYATDRCRDLLGFVPAHSWRRP